MRQIFKAVFLVLLIYTITSCTATDVSIDYDEFHDFSKYFTYNIVKPKKNTDQNSIYFNELNQRRFVNSIDKYLGPKGFERPDNDQIDFYVVVHLRFDKKLDITSYGYKYYPFSGYQERYIQARVYQKGSIILDIVDKANYYLVWRAVTEGVLNESDKPDKVIDKTIGKMLKNFPPAK
jgi:uncharacterized protein DUF4136